MEGKNYLTIRVFAVSHLRTDPDPSDMGEYCENHNLASLSRISKTYIDSDFANFQFSDQLRKIFRKFYETDFLSSELKILSFKSFEANEFAKDIHLGNLSYCICRAGFVGNLRKLSNVNKEFEIFEIFYEALDF